MYTNPKEAFTNIFAKKWTTVVNRILKDTEVREILIETLAFKNANSGCKRRNRPLMAKSALIDEWIRKTTDIGSHIYKVILIGELISKKFFKKSKYQMF